jgi:putative NADPH-quinone reductase
MRTLVVYCHPVAESFTAAVRDAALAGLRQAGHEIRLVDLYADDFDPRLTREGRLDYHNPSVNTKPVQKYVDAITWAEAMVYVFPTWNQGFPAMLKGWFDRVWVPDTSFHLKKGGLRQFRPLLTNVKVLVGITTGGAPRWLTWLTGHTARRTLLRGMRAQCHPRCRTMWLALYRIDGASAETRKAYLGRVEARMSAL